MPWVDPVYQGTKPSQLEEGTQPTSLKQNQAMRIFSVPPVVLEAGQTSASLNAALHGPGGPSESKDIALRHDE
jgi:hypothetical protein